MSETRYPLCWPQGWKRTTNRQKAKFAKQDTQFDGQQTRYMGSKRLTVGQAVQRVLGELSRMGVREGDAIISTNVPVRLDGLPYSNAGEPSDPGAAVYWKHKGHQRCMAIDMYNRVADNIAAIAATLDGMRTVKRHGGAEILERAFQGFAALPERAGGKGWREILGFEHLTTPTASMVKDHFQERVKTAHPDAGGSRDDFEALVWARDAALRELAV